MIESVPWGRLAAGASVLLRWRPGFFVSWLITARTAFKAAYINYDYPLSTWCTRTARHTQGVVQRIEQLSLRTTGGANYVVAYDNNVAIHTGGICAVIQ